MTQWSIGYLNKANRKELITQWESAEYKRLLCHVELENIDPIIDRFKHLNDATTLLNNVINYILRVNTAESHQRAVAIMSAGLYLYNNEEYKPIMNRLQLDLLTVADRSFIDSFIPRVIII
jgi:hypothetical protein